MKKQRRSAPSQGFPDIGDSAAIVVRVNNLFFSYSDRPALKDFTLEARVGEVLGILGPNGSGKSTLFGILSTLMVPARGTVEIAGIDVIARPHDARRQIGVVFQSAGLDGKLSIVENLRYQGYFYGMKGGFLESRIEDLLKTFALWERREDRVEVLSGGLQRRAELAKGLLHQPRVLLLDEPSTGLDPAARRDFWRYLREAQKNAPMTVLLTTHLLDEADGCDRVAIVDQGRLVASGKPGELRNNIGGDVLIVRSSDVVRLQRHLRRKFGIQAVMVNSELHMETHESARMIPRIAQAYPSLIEEITMRKPTLEDVFLHETGHRLEPNQPMDGRKEG